MSPTDLDPLSYPLLIFMVGSEPSQISPTAWWMAVKCALGLAHLVVILLIIIIIQEVNGTDPVHCFVVPRVICHVIHQALQRSTAGKIIRACDRHNAIYITGIQAHISTLRWNYRASWSEYFSRLKSIWLCYDCFSAICQLKKWKLSHNRKPETARSQFQIPA